MSLEYRVASLESEVRSCKSEIQSVKERYLSEIIAMENRNRARLDNWITALSGLYAGVSLTLALCALLML